MRLDMLPPGWALDFDFARAWVVLTDPAGRSAAFFAKRQSAAQPLLRDLLAAAIAALPLPGTSPPPTKDPSA
jgi:hypothetical protein